VAGKTVFPGVMPVGRSPWFSAWVPLLKLSDVDFDIIPPSYLMEHVAVEKNQLMVSIESLSC